MLQFGTTRDAVESAVLIGLFALAALVTLALLVVLGVQMDWSKLLGVLS